MTYSRWALVLALCVSCFCSTPATSFAPLGRRPPVKAHRYVAASRIDPERDIEEALVQQVKPAEAYSEQVFEEVHPEKGYAESRAGKGEKQSKGGQKRKEDRMLSTKTLYEILRASPDATRDELKRQYVTLARETHPDAIVGKSAKEREKSEVLFTEVAAAWRILSDKRERQRYDRSLKAKAFTEEVEKMAGEYAEKMMETAGPAMSRVLEQVGLPFFRKTAGTTVASINTAAKELKQTRESDKKVDSGSAVGEAIKAGQQVGRTIDRYDLLKKSRELELESLNEVEKSIAIKGELANVMNKRLGLSLRIPNSSISSSEALKLLEGLNTVDSVTLLEAVRMKQPLIHDINCLQEVEKDFDGKLQGQLQAEKQVEQTREALWKADTKARRAVEKEMEARRALEEAQREVIATRQALLDWKNIYDSAENQHRKASHDVDKVSLTLMRKQERVRTALRRKEEEGLGLQESASLDTLGLSDLERLRKEEEYLRAESTRLDDRVKRLRSRARKLKRRSEQLNKAK